MAKIVILLSVTAVGIFIASVTAGFLFAQFGGGTAALAMSGTFLVLGLAALGCFVHWYGREG